jgi:hypothetical protein
MGSYLQQYGVDDERRGRVIWRIVYAVLGLLVLSVAGYFFLHDFSEKRVANRFLDHINAHQFTEAYADWGCTKEHPCPNYDYARFLQDWGPGKKAASPWKVDSTDSCRYFLTVNVKAEGREVESLSVQRADKSLSFAPAAECQERQWRWKQFFARFFGGGEAPPSPSAPK